MLIDQQWALFNSEKFLPRMSTHFDPHCIGYIVDDGKIFLALLFIIGISLALFHRLTGRLCFTGLASTIRQRSDWWFFTCGEFPGEKNSSRKRHLRLDKLRFGRSLATLTVLTSVSVGFFVDRFRLLALLSTSDTSSSAPFTGFSSIVADVRSVDVSIADVAAIVSACSVEDVIRSALIQPVEMNRSIWKCLI